MWIKWLIVTLATSEGYGYDGHVMEIIEQFSNLYYHDY